MREIGGMGGIAGMVRGGTPRAFAICALIAVATAGCTRIDNALASVPIFAFMHEAPSFDP
jgi:hypothetical protein